MESGEQSTGSIRHVLIIDDDEGFRQFMSQLVGGLGFKVETRSKFEASDLTNLTASDVIFLDLMMPETDGIQVLNSLSRHQLKASIVLMSGTHQEVLATAGTIAAQSGLRVIGTLSKPFRSHDVRRILEQHCQQPRSSNTMPRAPQINIEDLLAGLERKEFDAFFQPIVDLCTYQPVLHEALARWRSEKFSLVTPDRFIAVAARHGVLPRLTRQIIHRALACAAKLKAKGLVWQVAVNIGAEDLVDHMLPERLATMLANHNLPPGSLTVELTESSTTVNETAMLGTLARMRLKGINLAIDDYGTSYSSLDRLSNIPFTSLKIDGQFISGMMMNRAARTIVESSITLGKRLNMRVVAEGIETEAQRDLLQTMGCELGQGNLFAPAMDFEKLTTWISHWPAAATVRTHASRGCTPSLSKFSRGKQ